MANQTPTKWVVCLLLFYSVWLISLSENFVFINQGDFSRTIGHVSPSNARFETHWPLLDDFRTPSITNVHAQFIGAIALISRLVTDTLSLSVLTQRDLHRSGC